MKTQHASENSGCKVARSQNVRTSLLIILGFYGIGIMENKMETDSLGLRFRRIELHILD